MRYGVILQPRGSSQKRDNLINLNCTLRARARFIESFELFGAAGTMICAPAAATLMPARGVPRAAADLGSGAQDAEDAGRMAPIRTSQPITLRLMTSIGHQWVTGRSCRQRYQLVPGRGLIRADKLKIGICEIFGVVRFSTFSTVSAQSGRSYG